ncbi:MAG: hypothetical protein J5725_10315 [Bacteroidales bacterium]|nr:hypothetical protein [Bacteroidales bacterium]
MKICTCDVCGKVLDGKTPMTLRYESDVFGFDLCLEHKMKEKDIDMREVYINKLREQYAEKVGTISDPFPNAQVYNMPRIELGHDGIFGE